MRLAQRLWPLTSHPSQPICAHAHSCPSPRPSEVAALGTASSSRRAVQRTILAGPCTSFTPLSHLFQRMSLSRALSRCTIFSRR